MTLTLWESTKEWFFANREQIVHATIPDPKATTALVPGESYFRLWLTNSFLKRETRWLKDYYPATHVSVRMDVAGEVRTLTRLARPAQGMVGQGIWSEFPVTGLLPYNGGTVEVEAGLSALTRSNVLGAAVDVIDDFSGLIVPPVSEALAVAGKVAKGVQTLLDAGDGKIFLAVHQGFSVREGGGNELAPAYFAVLAATREEIDPASLTVAESSLCAEGANGLAPLARHDYLLFRIEARRNRDDWRFPHFVDLIRRAVQAHYAGETASYERHRDQVLAEALTSPDLTPSDQVHVATAIRDELRRKISMAPGMTADLAEADRGLEQIMEERAPRFDARIAPDRVTLHDLLADL